MEMFGKVRRMFFRDGKSRSEIARRTGLSRTTIKKWVKVPLGTEPKYQRASKPGKLSEFKDELVRALKADAHRPRRNRRTALALFQAIKAKGYDGGYTAVTDFIRGWHASSGHAQFDWSEEHLVIGGVWRKMIAAHLKLCASRAFVVQAYPTQSHEMLFDAHTRAFAALGGIPRRGIYDNMKTAVDKVKKGKARIVNTRFAAMASHYLFDPDFCNVASGWEKGVVEKNVQDSRRRSGRTRQGTLRLLHRTQCLAAGALPGAVAGTAPPEYDLTIAEMLEQEQPSLMPMVTPFDGYVETLGKVSSTCLVIEIATATRCRANWSARWSASGSTRSGSTSSPTMPWWPATRAASAQRGALRLAALHSADRAQARSAAQWRAVRRHAGSRCSNCAACCSSAKAATGSWPRCWPRPQAGLEAVLVAVELVLESGNPSAEHVENVLNRLKRPRRRIRSKLRSPWPRPRCRCRPL
jgi:transposase